ncbi:YaiI/YqxD family protein [Porticoccaceae bacterium]|nr:YaiI/YqxD family protein [Porticoccaceae bacterium]MDB9843864.1 YaiI/YqxD family protein [Porticoccaceae bacterium]MDC1476811.1 YaiI/YqxD family protein [Porticoccaceae bacterium]
MKIYVDADACPTVIKDILYRVSQRTWIEVVLVANQPLSIPRIPTVRSILVSQGFDVADDHIVELVEADDLVITADIPLAAEVIDKGGKALNPRGELYTKANIKARLNIRDFMDSMRNSGVQVGGGPPPLNQKDRMEFANALDKYLARFG